MLEIPAEIWLKICAFACLDDGTTGRSLSSVSRHIRAVSSEYRYQSIAVTGSRQMKGLLGALRDPNQRCAVRHLYVDRFDGVNKFFADYSDLDGKFEDSRIRLTLNRLVSCVAPTLETLTIVSLIPRVDDTFDLAQYSFPDLKELVISGPLTVPIRTTFAPQLTHLDVQLSVLPGRFEYVVAKCFPNLHHLRLSQTRDMFCSQTLSRVWQLCGSMRIRSAKPDKHKPDSLIQAIMPTPRFLSVEPAPAGSHHRPTSASAVRMVTASYTVLGRENHFKFLDRAQDVPQRAQALVLLQAWEDRLRGGDGRWPCTGKAKADITDA